MKPFVVTLLVLHGALAFARTEAPWTGSAGEACMAQWGDAAVSAMNAYDGGPEFNRRKPWRLDEFGRLRGRDATAAFPPEHYGRYDEDRARFMWDYYEHAMRASDGGWRMPEMQSAGVPSLRDYVNRCRERREAQPVTPAPRTFFEPTIGRYRLDWCLHWASGCGAPAAHRFCRDQGYAAASLWEIDIDVAGRAPTYILGDDRTCELPACDGFRFIACRNVASEDRSASFERGFQRFGADYRVFTPSPATAEACQAACNQENRCKAWTFDARQDDGQCRLKHSVTPPTPAPCCSSGVRQW